jgi:hypothetical protein
VANITEEYWEVDGQSLHTWAYAIETLTGREGLPPRRGQNEQVAYRPGEVWRPKTFGPRHLSLAIWVKGSDVNGIVPGAGARAQFRTNLNILKSLFGVTERELALTRRVRTLTGLLVQTGKGECLGTMEPAMKARDLGALVVDIFMADPFWYGIEEDDNIPLAGATITNVGTTKVRWMEVQLVGPLTAPILLVNTTNGVELGYTANIAVGETVTIDTGIGSAISSVSGSVAGNVTHEGAATLMELEVGANALDLNAAAGTGHAVITYQPPYL